MKQELRAAIGDRFGSVNSDAHITFNVFRCDEAELAARIGAVQKFCSHVGSMRIGFDGYGEYPNGTFFLSPDADAVLYIRYLMSVFHRLHSRFPSKTSTDPHMSIARRLSPFGMEVARNLFLEAPALEFECDRISLRRFNGTRGQYDVAADFVFSGTATKVQQQLTLGF